MTNHAIDILAQRVGELKAEVKNNRGYIDSLKKSKAELKRHADLLEKREIRNTDTIAELNKDFKSALEQNSKFYIENKILKMKGSKNSMLSKEKKIVIKKWLSLAKTDTKVPTSHRKIILKEIKADFDAAVFNLKRMAKNSKNFMVD